MICALCLKLTEEINHAESTQPVMEIGDSGTNRPIKYDSNRNGGYTRRVPQDINRNGCPRIPY